MASNFCGTFIYRIAVEILDNLVSDIFRIKCCCEKNYLESSILPRMFFVKITLHLSRQLQVVPRAAPNVIIVISGI
jgi:hypothetical protein